MCTMLLSCQTHEAREFSKIKIGMEKTDVLEIMENPLRSERKNGLDEWTYVYYEKDTRLEKLIRFEGGKVVFIGDRPPPPISAEKRDEIQAVENQKKEEESLKRKEKNIKSYENFEKKGRGEGIKEGEIKYLPVFKPIH